MRSLRGKLEELVSRLRQKRFVAVDFDSRMLRIVQAERSGNRCRILKHLEVPLPEGLDMSQAGPIGEFLARTLREMRLGGPGVLMNVPRGQAVLKPLRLPGGLDESELVGMVRYQAAKELPFSPAEAVIDFMVQGRCGGESSPPQTGAGLDVLAAAVRLEVLDHYRQIALAAGLKLRRLGLRPCSNMRCVEACTVQRKDGSLVVVHVTAEQTEIDVLVNGALAFSRSAVVKPAPGKPGDEQDVNKSVHAVVTEVARSLQSYQAVQRAGQIDAVVLAGRTGIEPKLAEELSRHLEVPCEILTPARALGLPDDGDGASAFIAVLGLAIGHCGPARLPFDFLNPKRPQVRRDVKKIRTAAMAGGVAVLLLAGLVGRTMYLSGTEGQLKAMEAQLSPRGELVKENRRLKDLASRLESIDAWVESGRNWLDHWAYLSSLFPPCREAYITGLKTNPDGSMAFTVRARTSEVITDLGKRLAEAGYDFKPGQIATGDDPFGYPYGAGVKLIVQPEMKVDLASLKASPRPGDDAPGEANRGRAIRRSNRPSSRPSDDAPGKANRGGVIRLGSRPSSRPSDAAPGEAPKRSLRAAAQESEAHLPPWRRSGSQRYQQHLPREAAEESETHPRRRRYGR